MRIARQAERGLGMRPLQRREQSLGGGQLAVLLPPLRVAARPRRHLGILDKGGPEREHHPPGPHHLRFPHHVQVHVVRGMVLHQTLRTVATRKVEMPGPVDRHDHPSQQARPIQRFHPDEAPDHLRPQRR